LSDYGLNGQVRSVDSENGYTAVGYWHNRWGWSDVQWTLYPYGDLSSVSPDNIAWVDICP
jgi:hypothetical protein